MNNRSIISKGLDNKISAFILSVIIKRIASYSCFPQNITFVFTVQEEIGCRGAIVATNRLNPREAICLDVGIATDIPSMNGQTSLSDFTLHGGPGLCIAPDNNLHFVKKLEKNSSRLWHYTSIIHWISPYRRYRNFKNPNRRKRCINRSYQHSKSIHA